MKTAADMYMEDAHGIALEAMDLIEAKLKEYGIVLTDEQEDGIYVPMSGKLELLGNCNHRNEH